MNGETSATAPQTITRAGQLGWAFYQLASSPYFVIVNIFVFNAYFQKHVVGDNVQGQVIWGYTQALAGVMIPLLAPVLGALADAYGPRKPGIIWFSVAAIPAMIALWFVTPGQVALGFAAIVVAAVTMECAKRISKLLFFRIIYYYYIIIINLLFFF